MSKIVDIKAYREKRKVVTTVPEPTKVVIDYFGIGRSPFGMDINEFKHYDTLDGANNAAGRLQRAFNTTIYVFECISMINKAGNTVKTAIPRGVFYKDDRE